jgi:uncharacterized protein
LDIGDVRYQARDRGYARLFLDWFDYWLSGQQNHVTEMPKVQLFVMDKGWIAGDQWPLAQTRFTKYYLGAPPRTRRITEKSFRHFSHGNHGEPVSGRSMF